MCGCGVVRLRCAACGVWCAVCGVRRFVVRAVCVRRCACCVVVVMLFFVFLFVLLLDFGGTWRECVCTKTSAPKTACTSARTSSTASCAQKTIKKAASRRPISSSSSTSHLRLHPKNSSLKPSSSLATKSPRVVIIAQAFVDIIEKGVPCVASSLPKPEVKECRNGLPTTKDTVGVLLAHH